MFSKQGKVKLSFGFSSLLRIKEAQSQISTVFDRSNDPLQPSMFMMGDFGGSSPRSGLLKQALNSYKDKFSKNLPADQLKTMKQQDIFDFGFILLYAVTGGY